LGNQENVWCNISSFLAAYCKDPSIYAGDVDLLADVEKSCEKAIESTSWRSPRPQYFSEERPKLAIAAIAYLGNKDLFEQALSLAFSIAEDTGVKGAINRILERHGNDWLFST
jgi:hypothetical protein